jgi:adsorption protein B
LEWADRLVAGMLVPLAMWVLASGLDDVFLDLAYFYFRLRRRLGDAGAPACPREKKIALLIPAWREEAVIEQMLDHNLAAIQYRNYEVFVGAYPNDLPTLSRLRASEIKHPRGVHVVQCPHDGPTSKADCLNWVYQGMLLYEEAQGCRFEVLLHHDAEDLIHPRSLARINQYTEVYDMVQVPVLPLPTPWHELTHGVYCDEFAQSHGRDLHVRVLLGGFLPSCGVGTAYRRQAVDRLAWNNTDRLFQPDLLTEDYLIGLELHRLGCSQILLDAVGSQATREYFPRRLRSSVRQKGRWVAGIVLQGWQRYGWDAGPGQWYWLWRDRKGLIGHPMALLANLVFLYGLAGWRWGSWVRHAPWLKWVLFANCGLLLWRMAVRVLATQRFYGWRFALGAPLRAVWGNIVNFAATVQAFTLFPSPRWWKTDHSYPTNGALRPHKRRIGEVLVDLGLAPTEIVEQALERRRPSERLGECLVRVGALSETDLYHALAEQQSLPFELVPAQALDPQVLERLPAGLAARWQVVPVRITYERYLWVAGPELPTDEAALAIAEATGLEPRFQLTTPSNYRSLCHAVNWPARSR